MREASKALGSTRPLRSEDLVPIGTAVSLDPFHNIDMTELRNRIAAAAGITPPTIPGDFSTRNLATVRNVLENSLATVADIADDVYDTPNQAQAETALNDLRAALMEVTTFGIKEAVPSSRIETSSLRKQELITQANQIIGVLQKTEQEIGQCFVDIDGIDLSPEEQVLKIQEVASLLFGGSFKIFPCFNLIQPNEHTQALGLTEFLSEGGDFALEEWVQGVSKVRPTIKTFCKVAGLSQNLVNNDRLEKLQVIQFSSKAPSEDDRWAGIKLPQDYEFIPQTLSIVSEYPESYDPHALQCGMLLDEWTESIPNESITSGVSVNYNQPNSEPPQTLLLAVSPSLTGSWKWNDLIETLNETLDWAKKRTVDPEILQDSPINQLLPAMLSAISGGDDAPSLDLMRNITPVDPGSYGPTSHVPNNSSQGTN